MDLNVSYLKWELSYAIFNNKISDHSLKEKLLENHGFIVGKLEGHKNRQFLAEMP